ncbi:LysR family transcriptional regulator [Vibrio ulleungensis]|uniref:LysR family transcriptional regulator n=1 Tax=Vibrio ulleungensis TaxID=2807619 RepID=A0ABS2HHA4_9VIBR|nr:LysR family transcriptional regulator [Vibrio ulleungensis]MBM7036900.1 LysR family transcriptional regulator [Vibrio ulleungensis]
MDWNDLKYVIAIAEYGTLKAASSHLNVNSTTVWRRIQQLEKKLSAQLFIVSRKGYQLTETGQSVLENAKRIESLADCILIESDLKHQKVQGLIRITAPSTMAAITLPQWIKEFREDYPDVQFEILEASQLLDIEHREADIAIRASHGAPQALIARKMRDVTLSVYASQLFLDANGIEASMPLSQMKHLYAIDFVQMDNLAIQWYKNQFKHNPKSIYCNSISTALNAALNDQGIALLPTDDSHNLVELFRLDKKYNSSLWILANKDLRNTARIKAFWDFLIKKIDSYVVQG